MLKKLISINKNLFSKANDTIYALSTGTNTAISVNDF